MNYLDGRRGVEEQERIYAYVETLDCLLTSYATHNEIANAAAKIEAFKLHPGQSAVSFA